MTNQDIDTNTIVKEIAENNLPPMDTAKFKPLSVDELTRTLGLTIKRDTVNKLMTFLSLLSAYTENSQINVSFNAPSSTGKSYIPLEIARLFPEEDVVTVGYCSPTAFFHDVGEFDKERKGYVVDLSRKILIFLDQPHTMLLQRLRSMLSHDKKEIRQKITDKTQKAGLRTKNIYLIGFPAVIFCTAGLKLDEQEATRFLLLSPEINQEKIREAIFEKIARESDITSYLLTLESNTDRKLLKERITAIKNEGIGEIKIKSPEVVEKTFFERNRMLKPRHQRDIGRIISLVKAFALLNLWDRERDGSALVANDQDIREAFKVWDEIAEAQELNLPPYVYNLYKDVIVAANTEKNSESVRGVGLTRQEILKKHFEVYHRYLPDWQLRQQIIPMLETSGLIIQEPDQLDRRKILIYPTTPLTISDEKNNSELKGGVVRTGNGEGNKHKV